jgi:hypothetical protein
MADTVLTWNKRHKITFSITGKIFYVKVKQSHYTPWRSLGGEEV